MNIEALKQKRTERITEWVRGGGYVVAVEVEAVVYPDRPAERYFSPETVRYLENLGALAEAGDVEALKRAGKVYVQLDQISQHAAPETAAAGTAPNGSAGS
jgi:hypothetical protein